MTPSEQLLLGRIALQKGLLTRPQLDECISLQETSRPPKPLGTIFVEKRYITAQQLEGLLSDQQATMKAPHPAYGPVKKQDGAWEAVKREDILFGKLAVEHGLLQQTQVDETLRIQEQMHQRGVPVRLGELMVKKAYLNPDQVKTLLTVQAKTILFCPKCGKNYNVKNYRAGKDVFCPKCSTTLALPGYEDSIDAHETAADSTEALKISPKMAEAYANRGIARRKKSDLDEAIWSAAASPQARRRFGSTMCIPPQQRGLGVVFVSRRAKTTP